MKIQLKWLFFGHYLATTSFINFFWTEINFSDLFYCSDRIHNQLLGSLRKTLLKYIFGEGRIQSRASKISLATYYLAFINSTFEFYELRKRFVESFIPEIKENEIHTHLKSASNTRPLLALDKIRELSTNLTTETSSSREKKWIKFISPSAQTSRLWNFYY